jgi:phosphatidylserine/phosphatidylglycerophosphate/cardiolipin synthase-like enzyme
VDRNKSGLNSAENRYVSRPSTWEKEDARPFPRFSGVRPTRAPLDGRTGKSYSPSPAKSCGNPKSAPIYTMRILFDREIYEEFTERLLVRAQEFLWIATANIKATLVSYRGNMVSMVDLFAGLTAAGVSVRIIHSALPSQHFRDRYEELDSKGRLSRGVEFLHCIRMHSKLFIVDGTTALAGSANLTGAGIGAKASVNRNFELGFLFEGAEETAPFVEYFDFVWMGGRCYDCGRRDLCPAPPV